MGMNIEVGNPEMLLAPPPPSYRRFIFMAALRQKLGDIHDFCHLAEHPKDAAALGS